MGIETWPFLNYPSLIPPCARIADIQSHLSFHHVGLKLPSFNSFNLTKNCEILYNMSKYDIDDSPQ